MCGFSGDRRVGIPHEVDRWEGVTDFSGNPGIPSRYRRFYGMAVKSRSSRQVIATKNWHRSALLVDRVDKEKILNKSRYSMTLWKTYYHIVWSTVNRSSLITADIETDLYKYIKHKCHSLDCPFHAIGGISDHIHLAISIPPSIAISEVVRQIKGSSSHFVNQTLLDRQTSNIDNRESSFAWQREYGVFSLGEKQLDIAVAYVLNQKQHHATGSLWRMLEIDAVNPDVNCPSES
jgi:putative transposase